MLGTGCLERMNHKQKLFQDLLFGLTLAGEVAGTFIGAVVIGLYLDDLFSCKPVLTFVLLILAFIQTILILLRIGKK